MVDAKHVVMTRFCLFPCTNSWRVTFDLGAESSLGDDRLYCACPPPSPSRSSLPACISIHTSTYKAGGMAASQRHRHRSHMNDRFHIMHVCCLVLFLPEETYFYRDVWKKWVSSGRNGKIGLYSLIPLSQ